MAIQTYALTPARIGKYKGRILKHAVPVISLGKVGTHENLPKNQSDTVVFRRYLPQYATPDQPNRFILDGAGDRTAQWVNKKLTSDGVTPVAETINKQDITAVLQEYSVLFGYSNRTADLYEDDIPKEMTQIAGEALGLTNEMVLFGVLKANTNRFYGGTGVSRATVNGTISLNGLRKIARSLNLNHARPITKMDKIIKATGMYGTGPVGRSFPVWVSTDLMPDLRELPGFLPVEEYSNSSDTVENEVGKCEEFRFIASPELVEVQDSGAAISGITPALKSTSGTYADVYQVIVGSQDAWGHVGMNLSGKNITALPPGQRDKNDPLGQRGYIGALWYYTAVVLNHLQMAVYEVATRDLNA